MKKHTNHQIQTIDQQEKEGRDYALFFVKNKLKEVFPDSSLLKKLNDYGN